MCMNDAVRIESIEVPKIGYKVYCVLLLYDALITPYFSDYHVRNKWNKSNEKKKSHETIKHCPTALHQGRISIFKYKLDALRFARLIGRGNPVVFKVKVKQTTKYAYKGFNGYIQRKVSYAVDQVKPIEQVI